MNIYLFGEDEFLEEIKKSLNKTNLELYLDGELINVNTKEELISYIDSKNESDIFVIDSSKISGLDESSIKIPFFSSKNNKTDDKSIELSYLKDNNIPLFEATDFEDAGNQITKKVQNYAIDKNLEESIEAEKSKDIENIIQDLENDEDKNLELNYEDKDVEIDSKELEDFLNGNVDKDEIENNIDSEIEEEIENNKDIDVNLEDSDENLDMDELQSLIKNDLENQNESDDESEIDLETIEKQLDNIEVTQDSEESSSADNLSDIDIDNIDDNKMNEIIDNDIPIIENNEKIDEVIDDKTSKDNEIVTPNEKERDMSIELDSIKESDMIELFKDKIREIKEIDNSINEIENMENIPKSIAESTITITVDELTNIISQALDGKTIELSIKVKG